MPFQETMQDLSALGGLPVYIIITAIFFTAQKYTQFWQLIVAFIAVFGITIIARLSHYRERPEKQKFLTWYQKIDASSFPSLHSGRIAALALIVGNFFMENYFPMLGIDILLILAIISVATMRIVLKRHYFTDVLFGIIIGILSALVTILLIRI